MTLYTLTGEWLKLMQLAESPEMDEDSFLGMKAMLEDDILAKADGYGKIIRQLEADVAGVASEIERLENLKKGLNSNIERMKTDLFNSMRATGSEDIKTELFAFKIRKNPPALKLKEGLKPDDIPAEYIKWGEPSFDKTAIKNAVKAGNEFDWAWLEQGESLQIK